MSIWCESCEAEARAGVADIVSIVTIIAANTSVFMRSDPFFKFLYAKYTLRHEYVLQGELRSLCQ